LGVRTPDGRYYHTGSYRDAREYIEYWIENEMRKRNQSHPEPDYEAIERRRIKTNRNNTINDLLNGKD